MSYYRRPSYPARVKAANKAAPVAARRPPIPFDELPEYLSRSAFFLEARKHMLAMDADNTPKDPGSKGRGKQACRMIGLIGGGEFKAGFLFNYSFTPDPTWVAEGKIRMIEQLHEDGSLAVVPTFHRDLMSQAIETYFKDRIERQSKPREVRKKPKVSAHAYPEGYNSLMQMFIALGIHRSRAPEVLGKLVDWDVLQAVTSDNGRVVYRPSAETEAKGHAVKYVDPTSKTGNSWDIYSTAYVAGELIGHMVDRPDVKQLWTTPKEVR
jgi:hypothetical protein